MIPNFLSSQFEWPQPNGYGRLLQNKRMRFARAGCRAARSFVLWRSAEGAEAASADVSIETASGCIRLEGEDGTSVCLSASISISPDYGVERVSEMYLGHTRPTVHYGDGRPVSVAISGGVVGEYGADAIYTRLLGQDVYYRDPEQRAWWGSVDGLRVGQTVAGYRQISMTVEEVEHGT